MSRLIAALFVVVTFGGYGYALLDAVLKERREQRSSCPSTPAAPHAAVEGRELRPCSCGRPTTGEQCSECDAREEVVA